MVSYEDLETWRNLCEWLENRWYNFAYIYQIEAAIRQEKLESRSFAYTSNGRRQRSLLWLNYKIQFISYKLLPVVNYWGERRLEREFGKDVFRDRGWVLVSDWEFKIDFLEQLVLLNREESDIPKLWIPALEKRLQKRSAEEIEAREKRMKRYLEGYCGWCNAPIVPYMFDCPKCTLPYED